MKTDKTDAVSAPAKPETFSELIRRKENVLLRLVPISKRQLEIVRAGDSALLLKFLQRKLVVMDEFEEIERQLAPHRDTPPEDRVWANEKEREETRKMIKRCEEHLAAILANDEISTNELAQANDEIQSELRKIRQSGKQRSYAMQSTPETPNLRRFNVDG